MIETHECSSDSEILFRPAILIDNSALEDYQACLQHLFVGFADESYKSALICPADGNPSSVLCPSVELIYHPLLKLPFFRSQNRRSVLEKLMKFKPTVLHCFSLSKARLTKELAETLGIPFLLTFNSCTSGYYKDVVYSPYCTSLLALSAQVSSHLKHTYKKFKGNIERLNTGTFVEDTCACFAKSTRDASMIIAQPFLNANDFESLLNAVRHLAIDGYGFILAIIGKGSAERHLHKMIKNLSLGQVVTIVPDIQPLRSVFAGADIFIRPEAKPEFKATLLEAMGVGMAVAACRDGNEDLLIDNETAVYFDSYDELSVYSVLQKLLDKRDFARKLAANGQQYLRENYTVTQMIKSLLHYYRDAQMRHKASHLQHRAACV